MTTETTTPEAPANETDKDKNFEAMRQQLDAANQRIAALEPKALREDVRDAGFDPSSDKGKVLVKDLSRGDVKVEDGQQLPEVLRRYAEEEYNWKPGAVLDSTESQAVAGQNRLDQIQGAGTSGQPPADLKSQYEQRIIDAREAGDFGLASRLQTEYERKVADQRARTG